MNLRIIIPVICLAIMCVCDVNGQMIEEPEMDMVYESSQNERVERNKEIDDIYRQFYFSKLIEFIKKINKENSQTKEAKHNPLLIG